jgi:hypothetical protein
MYSQRSTRSSCETTPSETFGDFATLSRSSAAVPQILRGVGGADLDLVRDCGPIQAAYLFPARPPSSSRPHVRYFSYHAHIIIMSLHCNQMRNTQKKRSIKRSIVRHSTPLPLPLPHPRILPERIRRPVTQGGLHARTLSVTIHARPSGSCVLE